MSTAELIYERSKALPEKLQKQVLNFVDALDQGKDHPRDDWSGVSLAAALRGMEDDQWPAYTDAQLAEDWR